MTILQMKCCFDGKAINEVMCFRSWGQSFGKGETKEGQPQPKWVWSLDYIHKCIYINIYFQYAIDCEIYQRFKRQQHKQILSGPNLSSSRPPQESLTIGTIVILTKILI